MKETILGFSVPLNMSNYQQGIRSEPHDESENINETNRTTKRQIVSLPMR